MKKILIELNQNCNLNCEYCFYKDYGRKNEALTVENLIEKNIQNYDVIYLTGGEPFLNKDIKNILFYLNKINKKVSIYTNGIILNKMNDIEFKENLNLLDEIVITLDSFNKDYNLRENSEKEVLECIEKIVDFCREKLKVKIGINLYNLEELEMIVENLLKKGVQSITFNLIHDIKKSDKSMQISSDDEFTKMFFILKKYKKYINESLIIDFYDYYKKKSKDLIKKCICGEKFFFMDCEGKEYSCPANLDEEKNKSKCFSEECINLWEMF